MSDNIDRDMKIISEALIAKDLLAFGMRHDRDKLNAYLASINEDQAKGVLAILSVFLGQMIAKNVVTVADMVALIEEVPSWRRS